MGLTRVARISGVIPLLIAVCLVILPPPLQCAFGGVSTYLARLRSEGKERVCVEFADSVDESLVQAYGGTVLRRFSSFRGLLCELPQSSIEALKGESSVIDVVEDIYVAPMPPEPTVRSARQPDNSISIASDSGQGGVFWNMEEEGINAYAAHAKYGLDGEGVVIAILVPFPVSELRVTHIVCKPF